MLLELAVLGFGLFLLIQGSDYFVKAAARLAKQLGVSEFIIGLTLVALGTSLPELVSSIYASVRGDPGLIVGTIAGANIANISLIIGVSALIAAIATKKIMVERDGSFMVFSFLLIVVFVLDGQLERVEGLFLILLFFAYTMFLFENSHEQKRNMGFGQFGVYFVKFGYIFSLKHITRHVSQGELHPKKTMTQIGIMAIAGFGVFIGANFMVNSAVYFASYFQVPQAMIGIFVAIGTTMPEMSVAISAARKKLGNIVIGNALGSCLTNTLLVLGVASTISTITVSALSQFLILPFMVGMGILVLIFIGTRWTVYRTEGLVLLVLYILFLLTMMVRGIL